MFSAVEEVEGWVVTKIEGEIEDLRFQIQFQNLMKAIEDTDWRKNLKKHINFYNLHLYKLDIMNPKSIRSLYYKLKQKYPRVENSVDRINWLQNELKIFVWLLVASDQALSTSLDSYIIFTQTPQQVEALSRPFYKINRDVCHYQYKLLTCLEFDEHWDQEQNQLLSDLVRKYNFNCSWTTISKELFLESSQKFLRTAHSCREKWQNHLDTRLIKGNWTLQDDYTIIKNRVSLGKKWSLIAKVFGPTRTEHMIKNRFKVILKRQSIKKEIRSIEEYEICQQIQRKLLGKMASIVGAPTDSNTTANSPAAIPSIYLFQDVIVKAQELTDTVCIKQGEDKPIPQGLEAIQTLSFATAKMGEADWDPSFASAEEKCDNTIPIFVDQEFILHITNGSLMEEPKLEFFF